MGGNDSLFCHQATAAPSDQALQARVVAALKSVYDPEIPVDIYDLGLIYRLAVKEGRVELDMTLTAPACPVAGSLPGQVERAVRGVEGVADVQVQLVWEPPWGPERMSDEARLALGMF